MAKLSAEIHEQIKEKVALIKSMEIKLSKGDKDVTEQMMHAETLSLLDITLPVDKRTIKK